MRWLPSVASRPTRQRTPSLAARDATADCRVRAHAVLPQPSGSRFQTHWFLHLLLPGRRHKWSRNRFLTRRGGFCTPRTGAVLTASTDRYPSRQRAPSKRLDL
jgi:hypothetical protein